MVAVPPGATEAVTIGAVEAAPPLMVTEHHASKFRTVRVTFPPPASEVPPSPPAPPPSAGGAPVSAAPLELPPEVPLNPPLDPLLELADPLPELAAAPPLELVLASSGVDASDGVVAGVELLLQAMVPASVSAPMLVTASQLVRIVCISSLQVAGILSRETLRKRALLALPRSRKALDLWDRQSIAKDASFFVTAASFISGSCVLCCESWAKGPRGPA